MSLTREQVFDILNKEREWQDKEFDPNEMRVNGVTRGQEFSFSTPHILQLETYATQAHDNYVNGWKKWDEQTNKLEIARSFAKAAAIAIRALEKMHSTELLLEKGLRNE